MIVGSLQEIKQPTLMRSCSQICQHYLNSFICINQVLATSWLTALTEIMLLSYTNNWSANWYTVTLGSKR